MDLECFAGDVILWMRRFLASVGKLNLLLLVFVEDINLWMRATNKCHQKKKFPQKVLLPLCASYLFHRQWKYNTLLKSLIHAQKMTSSRSHCCQSHLLWTGPSCWTAGKAYQITPNSSTSCHQSCYNLRILFNIMV